MPEPTVNIIKVPSYQDMSKDWSIATWLGIPEGGGSSLAILVAGATYSHDYWDWPTDRAKYSFVRWMNEQGFATLNFDRLGIGASEHPPAADVTIEAHAHIVNHLVKMARSGDLGGVPFEKVALIGHSLGSLIVGAAAATYGGVDAVVETGAPGYVGVPKDNDETALAWMHPARADPRFAGTQVADGYFTTHPGGRAPIFFWHEQIDQQVVADDEEVKETCTVGEMAQIGTAAALVNRIEVPALVIVGERDEIVMAMADGQSVEAILEQAASLAPANFQFAIVPGMGHNLTMHLHAREGYKGIGRFLKEHLG